jgi:hypothetical protein
MRQILLLSLLFAAIISHATPAPLRGSNFEFSKSVYKVKATIKKQGDNYILVAESDKSVKYSPAYLPDEYKKNGLEVTFDGDLGRSEEETTPLNIHKVWVDFSLKEKFHLAHKNYDLN